MGELWLSSTPLFLLFQKAEGYPPPPLRNLQFSTKHLHVFELLFTTDALQNRSTIERNES